MHLTRIKKPDVNILNCQSMFSVVFLSENCIVIHILHCFEESSTCRRIDTTAECECAHLLVYRIRAYGDMHINVLRSQKVPDGNTILIYMPRGDETHRRCFEIHVVKLHACHLPSFFSRARSKSWSESSTCCEYP